MDCGPPGSWPAMLQYKIKRCFSVCLFFFLLEQCFSNLLKHFKSVLLKSTCNAGDPRSSPGSGRSAGGGTGYPLQYSWASLVAQLVKNLLQCRRPRFDPWVRKISWRREGHPLQYSGLENSTNRVTWQLQSMESQRVGHNWATFTFTLLNEKPIFSVLRRSRLLGCYLFIWREKKGISLSFGGTLTLC